MSDTLQFSGSASTLGDLKLRAVPLRQTDETLHVRGGEEWLRTGYLVPYAAKYAPIEASSSGRRLYAYSSAAEQTVLNAAFARKRVWWDGTRYIFAPAHDRQTALSYKAALDSAASVGLFSATISGGANLYDTFMISSGANAGRILAMNDSATLLATISYSSGAMGAWTQATTLGVWPGGNGHVLAGKPDGSLIVAVQSVFAAATGAGAIKTTVDGGVNWTQRTSNLAANADPRDGAWCATAGKFVFVSGSVWHTTTDGFTWAAETGAPYVPVSANKKACSIADTGTATIVLGSALSIYRSTGAAFATVATPRQLVAIVAAGTVLYAVNSLMGLERSADNGTSWTELGQLNGPLVAPNDTAEAPVLAVANGKLFYSLNNKFARFTTQDLPSLTPDSVGLTQVYASSSTSEPQGAAGFVRIK